MEGERSSSTLAKKAGNTSCGQWQTAKEVLVNGRDMLMQVSEF